MSADSKLRVRGHEIYLKSKGIDRSKWDMRAESKTKIMVRQRQRQKNMHRCWKFEKKVDQEADSKAK